MSAPVPVISAELRSLLRRLKLGQALDTLPERLVLASGHGLGHAEFLEMVLSDEVARRDRTSVSTVIEISPLAAIKIPQGRTANFPMDGQWGAPRTATKAPRGRPNRAP